MAVILWGRAGVLAYRTRFGYNYACGGIVQTPYLPAARRAFFHQSLDPFGFFMKPCGGGQKFALDPGVAASLRGTQAFLGLTAQCCCYRKGHTAVLARLNTCRLDKSGRIFERYDRRTKPIRSVRRGSHPRRGE